MSVSVASLSTVFSSVSVDRINSEAKSVDDPLKLALGGARLIPRNFLFNQLVIVPPRCLRVLRYTRFLRRVLIYLKTTEIYSLLETTNKHIDTLNITQIRDLKNRQICGINPGSMPTIEFLQIFHRNSFTVPPSLLDTFSRSLRVCIQVNNTR